MDLERPVHSHSIISLRHNSLMSKELSDASTLMSVSVYDKNSHLVPIEGDRSRMIPVDHIVGFTTIR